MKNNEIQELSISDVRSKLAPRTENASPEIFTFSDLHNIESTDRVYRIDFMVFYQCERGEADVIIDGRPVTVKAGDLVVRVDQQLMTGPRVSDDFEGRGVVLSRRLAQESLYGMQKMWLYLYELFQHPVYTLSPAGQQWFARFYRLINERIGWRDHAFYREALTACLRIFFFDICHWLHERVGARLEVSSRSYHLFEQFLDLVQKNYKHERSVKWYSDRLCLTPKYLSEIVKQASGRTARQWLMAFVLIEIKSLLRNTDYSIKQIAQEMNFSSQSSFGKYFHHATGLTPKEYRNG